MAHPETVQIKAEKIPGNELGFIVINKEDFDPEIHELFAEETEPEKPVEPVVEQPTANPWAK